MSILSPDCPKPEYPRPQFVRQKWLNLNGRWEFEMDFAQTGLSRGLEQADRLPDQIVVPFCPESKLSGVERTDFLPPLWYRRTFTLPADWHGQRLLLHFGAVDYECQVWINGREAGTHRGGYAPFSLDITRLVHWDQPNTLVVHTRDDAHSLLQPKGKQSMRHVSYGCLYTRVSGIWQTVWLEPVPQTYLAEMRYVPDLANGQLHIQARLGGAPAGGTLTARALEDGRPCGETTTQSSGEIFFVTLSIQDPHAWCPADPFLYDLHLDFQGTYGSHDAVQSYFGLRSVGLSDKAFLLNGRPLFLRQVLDQGYYPDGLYTAPSDHALRRDVELGLAFGFNGARLHQKVFEPRFLYWADRLGYLVWSEFGDWGVDVNDPALLPRFLDEWLSVVAAHYNHPSIIGWCPFNETNTLQRRDPVETLYRVTQALDPTRPVIDSSGYVHVQTDIYDVHDYDQNVETFAARYRPLAQGKCVNVSHGLERNAPHTGQPFYVSEYGGIWWNPGQEADRESWGYGGVGGRPRNQQEYLARYRGLSEALLQNPGVCGFCYTQLYDVEQEVNGLCTYDRQPKFDPSLIRAINDQQAAIENDR